MKLFALIVALSMLAPDLGLAATLYAKTAGGNWSAAGTWSNTGSGGGDSSGPPTAADDVIFDSGSGNVTVDGTSASPSLARSMDANGYTGTVTMGSTAYLKLGDGTAGLSNIALRLASGMGFTPNASATIELVSTSATQQTINSAGKTLCKLTLGAAGSWILDAALTLSSSSAFTQNAGAFDTGNYNVTSGTYIGTTGTGKTLTMGSSTWTINNTGVNVWNLSNTTVNAGTSTIQLTAATGANVISSGGYTFYNLTFNRGASTALHRIANNGTWNIIRDRGTAAHALQFTGTSSNTVKELILENGTTVVDLQSNNNNTATITKSTPNQICLDYVAISSMTFSPSGRTFAGANSTNVRNNSGITFTNCPANAFFNGGFI